MRASDFEEGEYEKSNVPDALQPLPKRYPRVRKFWSAIELMIAFLSPTEPRLGPSIEVRNDSVRFFLQSGREEAVDVLAPLARAGADTFA